MKRLDQIPLTKKLSVYLKILLFTFVTFLAAFFAFQLHDAETTERGQLLADIRAAQSRLMTTCEMQEVTVRQLSTEESVFAFMDADHTAPSKTYAREVETVIKRILQAREYIPDSRLVIAGRNTAVQSYGEFRQDLDELLSYDWIDREITNAANSQQVFWGVGRLADKGEYLICYQGVYSNEKPYALKQVVLSAVPITDVREALSSGNGKTRMLLLRPDGIAVAASENAEGQRDEVSECKTPLSGWVRFPDGLAIAEQIPLGDSESAIGRWKLTAIGYFSSFSENFFHATVVGALVFLIAFLLLALLTKAVTRNIVVRSRVVLEHIGSIASEDFTLNNKLDGGDEFYLINEELNGLGIRLNRLIQDDLKSQIEQQRLQLAFQDQQIISLQNQINPHYIVNTLEAIRMKLLIAGEEESAEMVRYLAESLRVYAWAPHSMITIREELAFVEQYLTLQNYRFIEKIRYHITAADEILPKKIPRFLVQPLIENAIKHGFKNMVADARLEINFFEQDGYLFITMEDNGLGMDAETLQAMREHLRSEEVDVYGGGGHIGMLNVHHRLRLLYGADCGMSIESREGQGTKVQLKLRTDGEEK